MNLIITLSKKNKGLQQKFKSVIAQSGLNKNNITFTTDWISALGYATINPNSSIWIDPKVVGNHFHEFFQELGNINQWLPYIMVVDGERIQGEISSGYEQLFSLISSGDLPEKFDDILSRLFSYFELLSSISKQNKKYLRPSGFSYFTGNSSVMIALYKQILKIAETNFTVLITGNSGSGKELAAKTIHELSPRKDKRFQSINCSAIPDNLLESELFGYEKGAFTDASQSKPGKFELADGGTIFLDEIGDMPVTMQAKLLRVIEDQKVERLGGTTEKEIDIRLLAATHKNLKEKISDKTFREDLYYRLNVIPVQLPSLCEKKNDIPLIILSLLNQMKSKQNMVVKNISFKIFEKFQTLPLKGNVRELENILTRVVFQSSEMNLTANLLDEIVLDNDPKEQIVDELISSKEEISPLWKLEKMAIGRAFTKLDGNMSQIASSLEISRSALYRKMKKYNLMELEES